MSFFLIFLMPLFRFKLTQHHCHDVMMSWRHDVMTWHQNILNHTRCVISHDESSLFCTYQTCYIMFPVMQLLQLTFLFSTLILSPSLPLSLSSLSPLSLSLSLSFFFFFLSLSLPSSLTLPLSLSCIYIKHVILCFQSCNFCNSPSCFPPLSSLPLSPSLSLSHHSLLSSSLSLFLPSSLTLSLSLMHLYQTCYIMFPAMQLLQVTLLLVTVILAAFLTHNGGVSGMSSDEDDVGRIPERPDVFDSPEELRDYLRALNEYFAVVGRPRWICKIMHYFVL